MLGLAFLLLLINTHCTILPVVTSAMIPRSTHRGFMPPNNRRCVQINPHHAARPELLEVTAYSPTNRPLGCPVTEDNGENTGGNCVKICVTSKNICRHFLREFPAGRGGGVADTRDLRQRGHREQPLQMHGVRSQSCLCKSTYRSGLKSGLSLCRSLCMAADIMKWRRG